MNEKGKSTEPKPTQVGYRNPPAHTRFQRGHSGNPNGRPKGSLNIATVLERTLREKVIINENGNRKQVTKLEAAVKQLVNKAASGELRALRQLVDLVITGEERATQTPQANGTLGEIDMKVVLGILERLQNANKEKKMKVTANEYRTLLRRDFYAFIEKSFYELNPTTAFLHNRYIEVIAAELERCRRGEIKRLIINVPPRSLKSQCASVAFPAWLLGHDPSCQIICASYAQDLADKLASDCRSLVMSGWYRDLFPTRLTSQRPAVEEFMTTKQGFRLATSVGGVLTGRGADFIIIDDPLKPEEALSETQRKSVNDWFDHTLYSRLNDKRNGCIILIMQRLHEDDLVGHVQGQEPWRIIRFPAIAEEYEKHLIDTPYGPKCFERHAGEALHAEREPLDVLQRLREALGEYNLPPSTSKLPLPWEVAW